MSLRLSPRVKAWAVQDWGGVLILAALCAVLAVLEPRFVSAPNLLNVLRQAAPLALATLGQTVVVIAGGIDLSQGSAAALSSMLALIAARLSGSAVIGWLTALAVATALGSINGLLVARWGVPSFVATLGMLTYARGISLYLGGGLPIEFPPAGYSWLGWGYVGPIPISAVVLVIACVATHLLMTRTTLGRQFYAVGGNAAASALSGIDVGAVRFWSFTVGGLLTGLGALLLSSRVNSGQPALAPTLQFETIAAVAIGGVSMTGGEGTLWKALAGVGVIAVLNNGLNLLGVSTYIQQMVIGGVTIAAVALDNAQRQHFSRLLALGRDPHSGREGRQPA